MDRMTFIKEVAHDTNLKPEVVRVVLDRATDIIIEQMVNDRNFRLASVFTSKAIEVTNKTIPGSRGKTAGGKVAATKRLNLKVSTTLKTLFKLQQEFFPDKPFIINRDNWRSALSWSKTQDYKSKIIPLSEVSSDEEPDAFDKFFDDFNS